MKDIRGKNMTSEEAIEILTRYKEESEEDYYVKRAKALTMAIKALEQESVLDKIRAEILEKCFDVPYKNQAFDYGLKIVKWSDVREILDKHKTESEGKE